MYARNRIIFSRNVLQNAQSHQSSNTSFANLSGNTIRFHLLLKMYLSVISVMHFLYSFFCVLKAPINHGIKIEQTLAITYVMHSLEVRENPALQDKIINLGLRLGAFLSDAGWYSESEQVLFTCKELCIANNQTPENWFRTLDCCHK